MKIKKLLAIVLCIAMVFSTIGTIVFATEDDVTAVSESEGWYWDANTLYIYQGKITKGELYNALVEKYGSGTYKYGTSKPTLSWALGGTEVKSGQTDSITLSGGTLYVGKKNNTFSWSDYSFPVIAYGFSANFPTLATAKVHMDGNVQAGEQHVTLKAAILAAAVTDWGDYAGITPTVYAYDDGTLSTGWHKLEWFIDSALTSGIYPATASRPIRFEWPATGDLPAYTAEVGIVFSDHNRTSNPVVTAPTCTTKGYTTYTCDCGLFTCTGAETAELGHAWVDATIYAPKTCTVCGETEGEPLDAVEVATAEELVAALAAGGKVRLVADIKTTTTARTSTMTTEYDETDPYTYIMTGEDTVLDLNGYSITPDVYPYADDETYYLLLCGDLTITDNSEDGNGRIYADEGGHLSAEETYVDGIGWVGAPTITIQGGTVTNLAVGNDVSVIVEGGNVDLYLYQPDYFYEEEEYSEYLSSLTFSGINAENLNLPEGYELSDNGDGTLGIVEAVNPVAKIGETSYSTLLDAFAAAKAGDTVELTGDLTLAPGDIDYRENIKIPQGVTFDGNNYTLIVEQTQDCDYGTFWSDGAYTIQNITIKVMGEREACRTIINVSKGGTIKNVKLWSTVLDIAINYDKPVNGMTLLVENCEISGSTYAFYCDPNASEIDVTLKDNVIYSQRFGSMQHDECIVGNTLTGSCSKGISLGASFTGVVEKNIFEGARALSVYGTQTISENVIGASSIVELNNGAVADLSGNYWGGGAPGETQIVPDAATSVVSYTVESYYTTYEDGVLSDLVMIQTAVAKIGDVEYATLAEAVAAAQNGDTIVLVGDVEFTDTTISVNKEITIDGNGHKITTADTFNANASNAMLDIMGGVTVTFNNVTFDGIKNCAIMRTVNANVVIDNCTVTNCEHTVAQGLFRLACGNATITDSKFIGNDCTMVISFGYDAANDTDVLTIDGCLFEGNTCGETAVVYFADGDYGTVKNTKFVDNKVSTNGNAATLYLGWGDGFEVSGCTFEGNNVTTTHATTKRFAGAIFCDGCVVKNNVFKNNTAIRNGETISTTVAVGAYYGAADVSENYWNDGSKPVIGEDYTVEYTRNPVENVSYYTTYEDGVLSDLVMIQTAVAQTMNANGEVVGSYADFESAVAAACADETITRIEILSDFEQKNVVNTADYYYVKQALTIGTAEGKKYTVTGATFAICIMGGSLTIAENVTIENLDVVANGFATSGDNMTINGTLKALSLKQWTSDGTITVNGNVWLGYGDGQLDLAYGNGTVTVNGNGDKTNAQFTAGYSGTRGNGNTLNLKDTFFEAGAWFTMNGSNGTINVDNSVLNVNGGDSDTGFSISNSGNVINLTNGAELKARNLTVGENNTVNLGAGCSITVTQLNGAGKIVIDATGMTAGSVAAINANASAFTGTIEVVNSNMTAEIDENGNIVLVEAVYPVAKIGDVEYVTLAEAVAAAQNGDTIVVLDNIAVSDGIVIAADKTVVLDLNGYTVSREQTETATANSQLIKNLGTLTIKDSSEQKTGKLSYTYTGAQVAYSVSTISNNQATLTVESGTIENNTLVEYTGTNGVYAYAIDSLTNGNLGEASVTVTGGTIKSDYMAIRQFVNSTTDNNILVVTDGEIVGGKRAINVQGSNNATKASNTAVLEISGGVVKAVSESGYSLCALSSSENMSVTGGTFVGTIWSGANGIISGGTYNISPYEGYVAIGFEINENEDGTFGIVVGAPEIVQVTVSSDEASQKLSVLVDVVNIPDDAKVYVASYNGNRMIEAKIVDKTDLSAELSSVNVDAVKCFVWDVNSQPCCDSQQVSKGEFASK